MKNIIEKVFKILYLEFLKKNVLKKKSLIITATKRVFFNKIKKKVINESFSYLVQSFSNNLFKIAFFFCL